MTKDKIVWYDSDGTGWTMSDIDAYADYCGICEQKEKEENKMTNISDGSQCPKTCEAAPVITEECRGCEYFVEEDNEMSKTNTKKNANVNANVKNNKEEKTMTKQDRIVTKTDKKGVVAPVSTAPMSDAEFDAMMEAQFMEEHPDMTLNPSAQPDGPFAQFNRLGQWDICIKNMEIITSKRAANPDTGEPAKFSKKLKVEHDDPTHPPFYINRNFILYKNGQKVDDVQIFDAKADPTGTQGWYATIKETSLEKKPEDLQKAVDMNWYKIKEGERIWDPMRTTEFKQLREILKVSELTFNGNKIEFPDKLTVSVYVYEDMPKKDAEDKVITDPKTGAFEVIPASPFYSVSFVPPWKQLKTDKTQKYDDRFTTSQDIKRRETIAALPGVINYLSSL